MAESLEEERDMFRRMWIRAVEQHIDLALSVLQMASESQWVKLVECAAEHLGDGWQTRDYWLYMQAKHAAMLVEGLPMEGQLVLGSVTQLSDRSRTSPQ